MRLVSLLTIAVLAVAPQAAFAACELVSDGRPFVAVEIDKTTATFTAPEVGAYIYTNLAKEGSLLQKTCTQQEFVTAFVRLNPSFAPDKPALFPVLNVRAAAPAPAAQPAVETAPAPQSAAVMSPEVERLKAKVAKLEAAIAAFEKSPSAKNAEGTQLLEKAKAELASTYTALQAELARKADKSYVDEQLGLKADQFAVNAALQGKADADKVYTKQEMDEKLGNLPAGEGLAWWGWLLIAVSAIGAILGALAFFRKTPAPEPINTSNFVTKPELNELSSKVEAISSRFKHSVLRTVDTPKPVTLKGLADGVEFDYPLLADGQPVVFKGRVVQHAQSGEAIVKMDELSKPVAASKLFGELASYIENGGQLPTLRAVS